jgi:hypothetical protein
MNGKDYAISVALSAAAGLVLMFFIWLLSLISWALVWAVFAFAFVPLGMKVIQFWRDTDCMDLSDFYIEVNDYFKEKQKKKKSSIDNDIEDIDW